MERLFLVLAVVLLCIGCSKSEKNEPSTNYPELPNLDDVCSAMDDLDFMKYCYENFDVNKDGKVSILEANAVEKIEICGVKSLEGIQYFSNLKELYLCDESHDKGGNLTALDISKNIKLEALVCSHNQFKELSLSNENLTHLFLQYNTELEKLNLSNLPNLVWLDCSYNKLYSLDVSHNTRLSRLYCRDNKLLTLNVSNNIELDGIFCMNNNLSTLDISNTKITATGLNTTNNPHLTSLWVNSNQASHLSSYVIDRTITEIKVK